MVNGTSSANARERRDRGPLEPSVERRVHDIADVDGRQQPLATPRSHGTAGNSPVARRGGGTTHAPLVWRLETAVPFPRARGARCARAARPVLGTFGAGVET